MYLHYVGNTSIDTMVSIEDIESVVRNLKKGERQLVLTTL